VLSIKRRPPKGNIPDPIPIINPFPRLTHPKNKKRILET